MSDIVLELRSEGRAEDHRGSGGLCLRAADEIERLRAAIETVARTFEKDREQGFKTRDKDFAITILRAALPSS